MIIAFVEMNKNYPEGAQKGSDPMTLSGCVSEHSRKFAILITVFESGF
jgi:hypothetical protein